MFLWNDARHSSWQQDRRELDAVPERAQALRNDPVLWREAKANNDLLTSIERVDVLTAVMAAAGAVALGASAWDLLASPTSAPVAVTLGARPSISWSTRW